MSTPIVDCLSEVNPQELPHWSFVVLRQESGYLFRYQAYEVNNLGELVRYDDESTKNLRYNGERLAGYLDQWCHCPF